MDKQKSKVREFLTKCGKAISKALEATRNFLIKAGSRIVLFFQKIGEHISHAFFAAQKWFVTKKNGRNTKKQENGRTKENDGEPFGVEHTESDVRRDGSQSNENERSEKTRDDTDGEKEKRGYEGKEPTRQEKSNPKDSAARKEHLSAREFFFNFFDFLASIAFMMCVFMIAKPILAYGFLKYTNSDVKNAMEFLDKIGISLFDLGIEHIEIINDISKVDIVYTRNCMVFFFICLFILLKFFALLISFGTKKIISFLLSILSIATLIVAFDKFIAFLLLAYLAYFIFQLSCGATGKAILVKSILIILLSFIGYATLNFFLAPGVSDTVKQLIHLLKLDITFI